MAGFAHPNVKPGEGVGRGAVLVVVHTRHEPVRDFVHQLSPCDQTTRFSVWVVWRVRSKLLDRRPREPNSSFPFAASVWMVKVVNGIAHTQTQDGARPNQPGTKSDNSGRMVLQAQ